jgi:hypothetical protein
MNDLTEFFNLRKEIILKINGKCTMHFNIFPYGSMKINAYFEQINEPIINRETLKEIRDWSQVNGFKLTKNYLSFNVGFRIENIDFALDIVTTFKNYFIPKWKELENGKYESIDPSKIALKYENIRKNADLLIVDNYSIDVYHEIIKNCFDDIFYTGSDIDVDNLLNVVKKRQN